MRGLGCCFFPFLAKAVAVFRNAVDRAMDYMNDSSLRRAKKVTLPSLSITELCHSGDDGAFLVTEADEPYFARYVMADGVGGRRDGLPNWVPAQFNLYPLVLEGSEIGRASCRERV